MGQEAEIKQSFPGLELDSNFKITSRINPNYNCIAWAFNYDDRFMWPNEFCFWPEGIPFNEDVSSFIAAFKLKDYSICDNADFEDGYRKIALYIERGTTKCTHAARQLSSGLWTSKLGPSHDIQHSSPYTIEGTCYGDVYCIMKRPFI